MLTVNTQVWVNAEMGSGGSEGVNVAPHYVNDESLTLLSHQLALDVPLFTFTRRCALLWGHDLPKLVRGIGRFLRVDIKERTSNIFAPLNVDYEALTSFGHQQALDEIIMPRP